MGLTLSVLRCPDAVPPETRQVPGGEFSIGRGADNDWILADPDRTLSRRHCVLAFRSGRWQLADLSSNGTFLNRDADPVGPQAPRDLRDGDRLRLGAYEIEVRIAEAAAWQGGGGTQSVGGGGFNDPFGDDPFAPARPTSGGFGRDAMLDGPATPGGSFGTPGVMLPADYDPLAPDLSDAPFQGPTQADNTPALEQAFRVPAQPSPIDFDDWDIDLSPASATPQSRPADVPPVAPQLAPPGAGGLDDWDIDLSVPPPPAGLAATPAAAAFPAPDAASAAAAPADVSPDPFTEPERDAAPSPAPAAAAPAGDLLAAFLRGAGMADARPADPVAAMEQLGGAFRALVAGLRQALIARATIKGEFRIEQTMIRARGNNPLKFSADDDDALAALLGAGRRTDMTPAAAIAEALADMRLHELASMAATQSAVRALVDRFDPAPLRAEGERGGGLLGAQKRARSFDLFEKLHGDIAHALADDFDSVFGKAFARAYEQALREVIDKERTR